MLGISLVSPLYIKPCVHHMCTWTLYTKVLALQPIPRVIPAYCGFVCQRPTSQTLIFHKYLPRQLIFDIKQPYLAPISF